MKSHFRSLIDKNSASPSLFTQFQRDQTNNSITWKFSGHVVRCKRKVFLCFDNQKMFLKKISFFCLLPVVQSGVAKQISRMGLSAPTPALYKVCGSRDRITSGNKARGAVLRLHSGKKKQINFLKKMTAQKVFPFWDCCPRKKNTFPYYAHV